MNALFYAHQDKHTSVCNSKSCDPIHKSQIVPGYLLEGGIGAKWATHELSRTRPTSLVHKRDVYSLVWDFWRRDEGVVVAQRDLKVEKKPLAKSVNRNQQFRLRR